eukprot:SM000109S14124  [mRNA]  locus=s109:28644:30269:+ [translate_table: standard]
MAPRPAPQPLPSLGTVGGHCTELLEVAPAAAPAPLHVVVIPGNPGICPLYADFVGDLAQRLGGAAAVTALGHVGHTEVDWEGGRLFSLADQLAHKVRRRAHPATDVSDDSSAQRGLTPVGAQDHHKPVVLVLIPAPCGRRPLQASFIRDLVRKQQSVSVVLVGHSIGAYMCLELLREFPEHVKAVVGLYPFIALNQASRQQAMLNRLAHSRFARGLLATLAGALGQLPWGLPLKFMQILYSRTWGSRSVSIGSQHILKYHVMGNFSYMGMTEFDTLQRKPDWSFLRHHGARIAFLFGVDDHWGPLDLCRERRPPRQGAESDGERARVGRGGEQLEEAAPEVETVVEREGHLHAFCCTREGSQWVACEAARLLLGRGVAAGFQ